MKSVGRRLRSRWVAALTVAGVFMLLGYPSAAAVVLFAWVPPSLAVLALRFGPRGTVDPLTLAGSS